MKNKTLPYRLVCFDFIEPLQEPVALYMSKLLGVIHSFNLKRKKKDKNALLLMNEPFWKL